MAIASVTVNLVAAKARVALLRKITVPHLELLAATIGSRLHTNIVKTFGKEFGFILLERFHYSVFLGFIREEEWGTFDEILETYTRQDLHLY